MGGQHRWYHASHILMLVSQIYMYAGMAYKWTWFPHTWWVNIFWLSSAAIGVWLVVRMVRRMTVRLNDSELLALRSVSVVLPLSIDAVDFGLDFFGAPLAWFIANQSALKPLRGASFFEGLMPGTQLIPSTTLGWWWANHVRKDGPWPAGRGPAAIAASPRLRSRRIVSTGSINWSCWRADGIWPMRSRSTCRLIFRRPWTCSCDRSARNWG